MSVRYRFRCQFCAAQPDPLTQLALEKTVRQAAFGAYGAIGFHPWKRGPYPTSLASGDTERAWIAATRRGITGGF